MLEVYIFQNNIKVFNINKYIEYYSKNRIVDNSFQKDSIEYIDLTKNIEKLFKAS